ncbi:MAG TPA: ABC transporter permease [Steroidobacteraceae bacterium]|nr:ABC transporter permease [Steroidobacteraceae bacterium]
MKYLPLIWSGIWRKPGRTALVILQVAVAFALFGVLQGMKSGMDRVIANTRADVLFVGPSNQGGAPLPMSYFERLEAIQGMKDVTYADGLLGTYQKPNQVVYALAIPPTAIWVTLVPEIFQVSPEALEALRKTRDGALITTDIGKKYGWHIGDRIPFTSNTLQSNGSGTWTFQIVGTMIDREPGEAGLIVFNYEYLNEARALNKGTVRNFYAVISDPRRAAAMSELIDHAFSNSSNETTTGSFRENAQQQMRSIGDLNFLIRSVIGAVLVALLFSITTIMMQTIRERTPELAVLKTLGFGDRAIFLVVVGESLLVCAVAAVIGLSLAAGVFPYTAKFVPGLSMPLSVVGFGMLGAVLVALITAAPPATRAARLQVVDALAGR